MLNTLNRAFAHSKMIFNHSGSYILSSAYPAAINVVKLPFKVGVGGIIIPTVRILKDLVIGDSEKVENFGSNLPKTSENKGIFDDIKNFVKNSWNSIDETYAASASEYLPKGPLVKTVVGVTSLVEEIITIAARESSNAAGEIFTGGFNGAYKASADEIAKTKFDTIDTNLIEFDDMILVDLDKGNTPDKFYRIKNRPGQTDDNGIEVEGYGLDNADYIRDILNNVVMNTQEFCQERLDGAKAVMGDILIGDFDISDFAAGAA